MSSEPASMNRKERLAAAFRLEAPDHTPILGGWIACPEHIMALAGADAAAYWADPVAVSIEAYAKLGSDGLIGVFVPRGQEDFRCVDHETYQRAGSDMSLGEAVERIDAMPGAEQIEGNFDLDAEYAPFSESLRSMQRACGDMLWMPAQWSAGAKVSWYAEFGYENFFTIVGLHPDRAQKLPSHPSVTFVSKVWR